VNCRAIPYDYHRAAKMSEKVAKELTHFVPAYVPGVKLVIQPQVPSSRADRDSRYHRDPVAPIQMAMNWGLTSWGPSFVDRWDQQKARFVDKDEVGTQPTSVFFTRGQSFRFQRSICSSSRSTARRSGF
jgi:hypothetical protein